MYDQLDDGLCAGLVGPNLQVVQPLLGAEGRQVVRDVEDLLHGVRLVQAQGARLVVGGGERALALLSHAPASRLAKSPGTRQLCALDRGHRLTETNISFLPPLDICGLHVGHVGGVVGEGNERVRGNYRQFALN